MNKKAQSYLNEIFQPKSHSFLFVMWINKCDSPPTFLINSTSGFFPAILHFSLFLPFPDFIVHFKQQS